MAMKFSAWGPSLAEWICPEWFGAEREKDGK